jgi:DNA-directed RNA polymerase subunit RPC12/RpoP
MPERQQEISAEKRIECPKCGSHDVRRSKSDTFMSILARMFGRWPFRCRSCRSRFYRQADPPADFQE